MRLTFLLLGAAVLSAWLPRLRLTAASKGGIALWPLLLIAATASGMVEGVVQWRGGTAIAILVVMAALSRHARDRLVRIGSTGVVMILALALALHAMPGFNNPILVAGTRLSPDSSPYTLWLNFDKASAGLVLLAFYSPRCTTSAHWLVVLRSTTVVLPITALAVFGVAAMIGYVSWAPKLPEFTLAFLGANLLFTCVAEEAFFRGMVQRWIAAHGRGNWNMPATMVLSATLFAAAHAAGGPLLVAFAALAGLGYALAFGFAERIEAAILTHFGINTLHFLLFTYPSIEGGRT